MSVAGRQPKDVEGRYRPGAVLRFSKTRRWGNASRWRNSRESRDARWNRSRCHIDVDFEHQHREEVMQYVYSKHGCDRAARVAAVSTYRPRGVRPARR
ncbi:hypothetical protein HQ619_30920 [Burkholderia gladioli]|nr:hypothetical protein [Burkholderia gladioli]